MIGATQWIGWKRIGDNPEYAFIYKEQGLVLMAGKRFLQRRKMTIAPGFNPWKINDCPLVFGARVPNKVCGIFCPSPANNVTKTERLLCIDNVSIAYLFHNPFTKFSKACKCFPKASFPLWVAV